MKRKERKIRVKYEYIESEDSQKHINEVYDWVFNKISEYEKNDMNKETAL